MLFVTISQYLAIACLSVLCIWYIDHRWKRRKWYSCAKNVPGPYALPVIGAAYHFLSDPSNLMNVAMKLMDDYPDIVKFWMGSKLLYVLKNPKYIEKVISHPKALDKDFFYEQLAQLSGDGLATLGGAKWRRHRKLINSSFGQKALHSFLPIMAVRSGDLVKDLQNTVGDKIAPLYHIISRYTVELTFQTAFGVNMNLNSIEGKLDEVIDKMIELLTERILKIWNHLDIIWYLSGKQKEFQYYQNRLREVVNEVVKRKMEGERSKDSETEIEVANDHENLPRSAAFLDSLMANTDLDESEIKDEVNTFIIAATDTTAKALTSLFAIFGIYPDIQEKVYREVIEKVGLVGDPTPEDLSQLEYTERVIKEVLRLFPPGFMISRYASGDIDIGDNITVPEGASIAIPILQIHRSGEYWEDPLKFDPDRFLPDAAKRHPLSYLGFSHGPRNCIGKHGNSYS
ncbi:unnamed protein product [Callosobruchus maculatus]|uniref:Cytochrome P450 n=2 Tax=Callosobruchus maculatus TaxID=64391 RepID=A0A653DKE0_CALMS|nr:unnamed protein product [Callosobruchus maculatus]